MNTGIGVAAALLAGLVSFISPCVLPLLPGYLSFLTGMSVAEVTDARRRWSVVAPAALFVLGFSAVFIILGASASMLGSLLAPYKTILARASGVLIMVFGLFMTGIWRPRWMQGEARFDMSRARAFGPFSAVVAGMAFGFGWTPCVGPALGAILTLAGTSGGVGRGVLLLSAYSLGLGAPFIAVALLLERMGGLLGWLKRHSEVIQRIGGIVLVLIGGAIATGLLGRAVLYLSRLLPAGFPL